MSSSHHETAASGPITYVIGIVAAMLSQMTMNDWLILFSLVLVLMRIVFELNDFLQRRADKKVERAERQARLLASAKAACEIKPGE